jgi:hypothetical protein
MMQKKPEGLAGVAYAVGFAAGVVCETIALLWRDGVAIVAVVLWRAIR